VLERFRKKQDERPEKRGPRILERVEYPISSDLSELMQALAEHEISGVQINSIDHEIIYPHQYRAQIDELLASLNKT